MVIDSSAIVAILLEEPEMDELLVAIASDPLRLMSAATFLETGVVPDGLKEQRETRSLDRFIEQGQIQVVPVDREQAEIARLAYRRFGKRNHAARLNLGDCFSYALARQMGQPLLFKGNDFSQTDIRSAGPVKGKRR